MNSKDHYHTTTKDSDKCKLINLQEELNVFLLNRAVCFSVSQNAVRSDLEDGVEFFKKAIVRIQEARSLKVSEQTVRESCDRIDKLRLLRLSTISQQKLLALCEALAAKALTLHSMFGKPFPFSSKELEHADLLIRNADESIDDKAIYPLSEAEKIHFYDKWKSLMKHLRHQCTGRLDLSVKEYEDLKQRMLQYENDLILCRHKNEYRDILYMEFYKFSKRVYEQDPVRFHMASVDASNYDFYKEINDTEARLRSQIQELTANGKFKKSNTRSESKSKLIVKLRSPSLLYASEPQPCASQSPPNIAALEQETMTSRRKRTKIKVGQEEDNVKPKTRIKMRASSSPIKFRLVIK